MSTARKLKKGVLKRRDLLPQEVLELQEMTRMTNARRFEATLVKGNSALVPRGQDVAAELEALARLLDNTKNQWVGAKLVECGYPANTRCDINLTTGAITITGEPLVANEPGNGKKA